MELWSKKAGGPEWDMYKIGKWEFANIKRIINNIKVFNKTNMFMNSELIYEI